MKFLHVSFPGVTVVAAALFLCFAVKVSAREPFLYPDPDFPGQTGPNNRLYQVEILKNGKILIAGSFSRFNGQTTGPVRRLLPAGEPDPSFKMELRMGSSELVEQMVALPDGRILIAGKLGQGEPAVPKGVARLLPDGAPDPTFHPGINPYQSASAIAFSSIGAVHVCALAVQPDGKVLIGGYNPFKLNQTTTYLARLLPDGGADPTFRPTTDTEAGPNGSVTKIVSMEEGRILIAGMFNKLHGMERHGIARLKPDGNPDESFVPPEIQGGSIEDMALQHDGRIVIAGFFTQVGDKSRHHIARLMPDGSLDASFDPGTGFSGLQNTHVKKVVLLPDGRILAGGSFTHYDGHRRDTLALIRPDGEIDPLINMTRAFTDAWVWDIQPVNDREFLIAGDFSHVGQVPKNRLARLVVGTEPPSPAAKRLPTIAEREAVKIKQFEAYKKKQAKKKQRASMLWKSRENGHGAAPFHRRCRP